MKRFLAIIIILILIFPACFAEEEEDDTVLFVMTKSLYGRIRPGKQYPVITSFELMTPLHATGRLSSDNKWVEIETAENELVWCNIDYLTERTDVFHVYTLWDEGVKIRSKPGSGKVVGTARKNQQLEITQVVMGYGKCSKGWVDLEYFIEDCE